MTREIDKRDFKISRISPSRSNKLKKNSSNKANTLVFGDQITIDTFDEITGNPFTVSMTNSPKIRGDYIRRAVEYVKSISDVLGFADNQPVEYVPDPTVQETSSDAVAVYLQQQYKGINIFEAAQTVRFGVKGDLQDTTGRTITVTKDMPISPIISVEDAVLRAAQHIANPQPDENQIDQFGQPLNLQKVDLTDFKPFILEIDRNTPSLPTVLEKGPFSDLIHANLVWFPMEDIKLSWKIILTMPNYEDQFLVIVESQNGDILYCKSIINRVFARGNVYVVDGATSRQMTDFPRNIQNYGLPVPQDLPAGFPDTWLEVDRTVGNCTNGHREDSGPSFQGRREGGFGQVWDGRPFWTGDFNGDGKPEILFFFPGDKNWWLGSHDGTKIVWSLVSNTTGFGNTSTLPHFVGRFSRNDRDEIMFYYGGDGNWWLATLNSQGKFDWKLASNTTGFGNITNLPKWIGDFNGNGRSDVLFYSLGDGNWWLGSHDGVQIRWSLIGNTLGDITYNPADPVGPDQQVLNIFYYCNYMHDYFYLLHFREKDGNFQRDNFGRGGIGNDPVDARSYPNPVSGTANMLTRPDGTPPIMNMGLVGGTINRHTAFDSSVVYHEFMHGVTNRLVGGPGNTSALLDPQSRGMGEGWGDYVGCTINNTTVVGAWVVNNPQGIRHHAYDNNFPHNFGHLGTNTGGIDYTEVHNIGEIWCATLMTMNRNIGSIRGIQLVVDALKLSPVNPSFLNMRDAILRALNNLLSAGQINQNDFNTARRGIWNAFAGFGMGPNARSNGAQLTGIVTDFNIPPGI